MANIIADIMATLGICWIERRTMMPVITVIFLETVADLVIGKIIVNNQLKTNLRIYCQKEKLKRHLMKKYGWSEEVMEDIYIYILESCGDGRV